MPSDRHERARFLIDESRVAGIPAEDREWLRRHIAGCAACARHEATTARIVRALGEFAVGQICDLPRPGRADRKSQLRAETALRWPIAAAAMVLIAAASLIRPVPDVRREQDDALLLERVASRVSRTVPEAMQPLLRPQIGENR